MNDDVSVQDAEEADGEDQHSGSAPVKAADANLEELEQMLREKALKSLKEAKQLLADDDDKWLLLLQTVICVTWHEIIDFLTITLHMR